MDALVTFIRIKKIRIKLKALEWPQHLILIFQTVKDSNSAVKGRIWLKFELIRDVMAMLVTFKYEEDPIKIEDLRSNVAEIRTHPRSYGCPCYSQE